MAFEMVHVELVSRADLLSQEVSTKERKQEGIKDLR